MDVNAERYWKSMVTLFSSYRGSEVAFAVAHDLNLESFRRWRTRLQSPVPNQPLFIELVEPSLPALASPAQASLVEFEFPNGVKMRTSVELNATTLKVWAQAVGGVS
jgi:hypothetical protein